MVLTVLAVSAVVAVPVVTATPLKLNPVFRDPENYGKIPERPRKRSQSFSRILEFPFRVRLGPPQPYNSRHLKAPEHFQNSLPPSTAGNASFFRSGSGEGLSEPVMEFPSSTGGISELWEFPWSFCSSVFRESANRALVIML